PPAGKAFRPPDLSHAEWVLARRGGFTARWAGAAKAAGGESLRREDSHAASAPAERRSRHRRHRIRPADAGVSAAAPRYTGLWPLLRRRPRLAAIGGGRWQHVH